MAAKEWKELAQRLRKLGYTVETARRNNHWHVRDNNQKLISVMPSGKTDERAIRNQISQLRRVGVPI
jgi:biotin operon repressor